MSDAEPLHAGSVTVTCPTCDERIPCAVTALPDGTHAMRISADLGPYEQHLHYPAPLGTSHSVMRARHALGD